MYVEESWDVLHEDYNIFHCILALDPKPLVGGAHDSCTCICVHTNNFHFSCMLPSSGIFGDPEATCSPPFTDHDVPLQRESILNYLMCLELCLAIIPFFKQKHVVYNC